MKTHLLTSLSIILAVGASAAGAQVGKSRAEVRAELDDAVRNGELLDSTRLLPLHELYPGMYPKRSETTSTVTREQVRIELEEAIRLGMVPIDEQGLTAKERAPHRFTASAVRVGKTREEVQGELKEAMRKGDLLDGTTGQPLNTLYPRTYRR